MYEAKAEFSEVIRRVQNGEEITITQRVIPTAFIAQPYETKTDAEINEAHIQKLIAECSITPAKQKLDITKIKGYHKPGAYARFMRDRI